MNDYDVRRAFERIELELIESMKRNLGRHLAEEKKEGFRWNMWQEEQLKSLKAYESANKEKFSKQFSRINKEIEDYIRKNANNAAIAEELRILRKTVDPKATIEDLMDDLGKDDADFFRVNSSKLDELLKATKKDMEKAEYAMLRRTNDQYRKIIFNSQVYANTGAGTLQQAVDMASRDFLRSGINCIKYNDGRLVNIASYAEMAIRTTNQRAVLISEGNIRQRHGWHLVRISRYGGCSETCLPWQGRVYVDDVYSGGTKDESKETGYPLLSEAIAGGLFHPNCKHRATTYFQGMQNDHSADGKLENEPEQAEHNKYQREIQRQKRIAAGSLDEQNVRVAKNRQKQWERKEKALSAKNSSDFSIPSFMQTPGHKELETFAHDVLHITEVPDLSDVDATLMDNLLHSIADIYEKLPETENSIYNITLRQGKYIMGVGLLDNAPFGNFGLVLNPNFFRDLRRTEEFIEKYVAQGIYPKGTTENTVIYHEFGHILEGLYIKRNYPKDRYEQVWENGIAAKNILEQAFDVCYDSSEDSVLNRRSYKDELEKISKYALAEDSEGIAECCHVEFTGRGNKFTNTVVSILRGTKKE